MSWCWQCGGGTCGRTGASRFNGSTTRSACFLRSSSLKQVCRVRPPSCVQCECRPQRQPQPLTVIKDLSVLANGAWACLQPVPSVWVPEIPGYCPCLEMPSLRLWLVWCGRHDCHAKLPPPSYPARHRRITGTNSRGLLLKLDVCVFRRLHLTSWHDKHALHMPSSPLESSHEEGGDDPVYATASAGRRSSRTSSPTSLSSQMGLFRSRPLG
jgi:hypothetical protein